MLITENRFYKTSEFDDNKIEIWSWVVAYFFDDWKKSLDIYLWENSSIEFYWLLNESNNHEINFYQNHDNSSLKANYLLLSVDNDKIKSRIYSRVSSNKSDTDIKILSLVWNNWDIDIDWIVEIDKWFKAIKWHLVEENLFLWKTWKIRWIPTLLVRSDDVEASHACKIEKISDDDLFYLRSRGLMKNDALNMVLESKVNTVFNNLMFIDKIFYLELIDCVFEFLKTKLTNK